VFAPNDAAFLRTARDLGYNGSSESGAWNFLAQNGIVHTISRVLIPVDVP
jgi:hypothetical protein